MSTRYLDPKEASELTGYAERTLATWRSKGIGPKYVKTSPSRGGRIRYREEEIDRWMRAREQGGEDTLERVL
ncbi:helix-turn-helix protein [Nocardiopsis sp. Huas11]|uniref:helix-turn-helix transcriptional regulator n=1 Tax=Nocardiopsis sp. Huas11 TaxID=2183912 RepID=UPI000EB5207F|nr:helix-turn-helix domain-containing protein [Nocardiopsis sp. Huas11]RKS10044.1 helix-turn-helix protein [Nocardiopsis sp. Huas11]